MVIDKIEIDSIERIPLGNDAVVIGMLMKVYEQIQDLERRVYKLEKSGGHIVHPGESGYKDPTEEK